MPKTNTATEVVNCSRCGRPFRRREDSKARTCGDDKCKERAKEPSDE